MQPQPLRKCSSCRVISQPIGRSDDVGSLEAAYDAHYLALLRMAVLLTDDQGQAEDLVHEAFVKAAARLEELPRADAKPYLRATILNMWRNRLRHLAVERRLAPALEGPRDAPGFEEGTAMWEVVAALLRGSARVSCCGSTRTYPSSRPPRCSGAHKER